MAGTTLDTSGYLGSSIGNILGTGGSNTSTAASNTFQVGQYQPYSINSPLGQTSFSNGTANTAQSPLQTQLTGLFGNQIQNNMSGSAASYNPNTSFLPSQYSSIFGGMQGNVNSMFNSLQQAQQPYTQQYLQSNLDNEQAKGTLSSTAGAYQTAGAQTAANSQMNSNMAQAQQYALSNANAQMGAATSTAQLGEQQSEFAPQMAQSQNTADYSNLLNSASLLNNQTSLGGSLGALQSNANIAANQNNFTAAQQQDTAQSSLLNGLLTGNGTGGLLNSLFGISGNTGGSSSIASLLGNGLSGLFGGTGTPGSMTSTQLSNMLGNGGMSETNNSSYDTDESASNDQLAQEYGYGSPTDTGQTFPSAGGQAATQISSNGGLTDNPTGLLTNPTSSGLLNGYGSLSAGLSNAGGAYSAISGLTSGNTMGQASGAISAASLANKNGLFGSSSSSAGGLLGAAGGALGLASGIQQGGISGYGSAAVSALKGASAVANLAGDSAVAGGLSSAAGAIAAPLALYNFASNWQSGATGSNALNGAEAGAAIGSIVPGIGTAIGAVIGGVVGAVSSVFGGGEKDPETTQMTGANAAGANALASQSPSTSFQYLAGVMDAKNNTAGHSTSLEQVFGREGETNVVNGMAQQINSAITSGKITASTDPSTVFSSVVEPWLNSKGVASSSLTFTDSTGKSSGSNLQDSLTNLVGAYMDGSLNDNTSIGVSGQKDTTLQAFA